MATPNLAAARLVAARRVVVAADPGGAVDLSVSPGVELVWCPGERDGAALWGLTPPARRPGAGALGGLCGRSPPPRRHLPGTSADPETPASPERHPVRAAH